MKKVAFKTPAKRSIPARRKSGGGGVVVHDRHGRVRRAEKVGAGGLKKAAPMCYDAEDIAEANRIGAALRRQHAL